MQETDIRTITVTEKNVWFLERSIPLFEFLDFFPEDSIGPPTFGKDKKWDRPVKKLTIDTDQGWSFKTDIPTDQKIFRNSARSRGSGKWVKQADLSPGDKIVIERLGEYEYKLLKVDKNG